MELKISEYAKINRVTSRTVWNWIKQGRIKTRYTDTGRVRVIVESDKEKQIAIYTRVSSTENKENLKAQTERLINYCNAKGYKVTKVVSEIGSGLNDTRPKLEKLLCDNNIDIIVVEHKDRLARFGINYIQKLLKLNNREIEIVNNIEAEKEDLIQDFISVITSFCARIYGQRRTKRKTEKLIQELINNNEK
jgi:predicted site-specific integrase-resolvase